VRCCVRRQNNRQWQSCCCAGCCCCLPPKRWHCPYRQCLLSKWMSCCCCLYAFPSHTLRLQRLRCSGRRHHHALAAGVGTRVTVVDTCVASRDISIVGGKGLREAQQQRHLSQGDDDALHRSGGRKHCRPRETEGGGARCPHAHTHTCTHTPVSCPTASRCAMHCATPICQQCQKLSRGRNQVAPSCESFIYQGGGAPCFDGPGTVSCAAAVWWGSHASCLQSCAAARKA
jgi:hypothetical protein